MIVGVVIGLLGVAVGISGLIGAAVIVKRRRYIYIFTSVFITYSAMLSTDQLSPREIWLLGPGAATGAPFQVLTQG